MSALTELAAVASAEAQKLTSYLTANNLPLPGFEVGAPGELPIPAEDEDLQASRMKLLRAAQDLQALALGPVEDLRWKAWNQYNDNISLHALMHFRVAEAVPLNGSASFAEISQKTGLKEPLVMRFIRHAAMYHVFQEVSPGVAAHTAGSVALLDGSSVRDWLDMTFEEWGPASVKAVEQLRRFPDSGEQSEAGFALAFGGQTIFEFCAERPERARVFGSSMSNFSKGASHKVEHLVKNYDWPALGHSTVVDVSFPPPIFMSPDPPSLTSPTARRLPRPHLPRARQSPPQPPLHRRRPARHRRRRRRPATRRVRRPHLLPRTRPQRAAARPQRRRVHVPLGAAQLARRLRRPLLPQPRPGPQAWRPRARERGRAPRARRGERLGLQDPDKLGRVHARYV